MEEDINVRRVGGGMGLRCVGEAVGDAEDAVEVVFDKLPDALSL